MKHPTEIALKRPFDVASLSWRVGNTDAKRNGGKPTKGQMLAYIDARDVMKRLDDVLGFSGWRDEYREVQGRIVCRLWLRIDGDWTWREDGAGDTETEGEKGGLSDAFKRAAVKWGVGRYLYDMPSPWVAVDEYKRPVAGWDSTLKLPTWAIPEGYDRIIAAKQEKQNAPV